MMKPVVLFLLSLPQLGAPPALACSCAPMTRDQVIAQAEQAFRGKVQAVSVSHNGKNDGATVVVTSRYKGEIPDRVLVITTREPAMCGYPMTIGKDYDFAGTIDDRGRMQVNMCVMVPLNDL